MFHKRSIREITKNIFEIQKLTTDQQIQRFVEGYIENEKDKIGFLQLLKQRHTVSQMAQNPLLLTMMILVYKNEHELPINRSLLLQKIVRGMLGKSSSLENDLLKQKNIQYDIDIKHDLLSVFAYDLKEQGLGLETTYEYMHKIFEVSLPKLKQPQQTVVGKGDIPQIIDETIKNKILSKTEIGVKFWLEVFQEYLSSYGIAEEIRSVCDLSGHKNQASIELKKLLKKYISNPDWHQPFAIASGLIETNMLSKLLDNLKDKNPLLAAICISNASPLSNQDINNFIYDIKERIIKLIRIHDLILIVSSILLSGLVIVFPLPIIFAIESILKFFLSLFHNLLSIPIFIISVLYILGIPILGYFSIIFFARVVRRILNRILLLSFSSIHSLLRSLIYIGTEEAEKVIIELRTKYRAGETLHKGIKTLVDRTELILSFKKDDPDVLLEMLRSIETRNYAMERLTQIREIRAIPPLLQIIIKEDNATINDAILNICTIVISDNEEELLRNEIVRVLKEIIANPKKNSFHKRRVAYNGLKKLGIHNIQQPSWWEGKLTWLLIGFLCLLLTELPHSLLENSAFTCNTPDSLTG